MLLERNLGFVHNTGSISHQFLKLEVHAHVGSLKYWWDMAIEAAARGVAAAHWFAGPRYASSAVVGVPPQVLHHISLWIFSNWKYLAWGAPLIHPNPKLLCCKLCALTLPHLCSLRPVRTPILFIFSSLTSLPRYYRKIWPECAQTSVTAQLPKRLTVNGHFLARILLLTRPLSCITCTYMHCCQIQWIERNVESSKPDKFG